MPKLRLSLLLVLGLPLVTACQTTTGTRPSSVGRNVTVEAAEEWRSIALDEHARVLEDLPPLFREAAARGRRTAASDRMLLDPELALPRAAPAPGAYRCRLVRLGASRATAGREAFCFVGAEAEGLSLTVETPARRLGGFLWESGQGDRLVFLGADFAPRSRGAPAYGGPRATSTAGIFERIGDFRYRLIVAGAQPRAVDVYELIAAPPAR
jgi:hypothetical protein